MGHYAFPRTFPFSFSASPAKIARFDLLQVSPSRQDVKHTLLTLCVFLSASAFSLQCLCLKLNVKQNWSKINLCRHICVICWTVKKQTEKKNHTYSYLLFHYSPDVGNNKSNPHRQRNQTTDAHKLCVILRNEGEKFMAIAPLEIYYLENWLCIQYLFYPLYIISV